MAEAVVAVIYAVQSSRCASHTPGSIGSQKMKSRNNNGAAGAGSIEMPIIFSMAPNVCSIA